ncbi:MAG: hypothetical protein HPY66_1731 [Firmicutes bacterium]|nr:hypothetical protein [Bacillota bacterium]
MEEIKVDDRRRIIGYRGGRIFHLIWFDRDHEVCPMGKPKRVNL